MKKLWVCGLFLFCFILFVLSVPVSYAQQKVISLRYSAYHAATDPNSKIIEEWCREVEKRTSGRVKVTYYPGGILTPPAQTYDSVVRGIADIGFSMCSFSKGRFPLTEVIDLPLGYMSAVQGSRLTNAFYKKFKPKEYEETKVMYLGAPPQQILLMKQKPVSTLEDIKGLKVRATGTSSRLIQLLGGAPVGMPITDVYDSLSKGIIDGTITSYEPVKSYKLSEVVRYVTEWHSTYVSADWTAMNKQKWESISPEDQKTIEAINEEFSEKQAKLWDSQNQVGKDLFLQKGGKIIKLTKEEDARWTKAVSPMLDEYVANMKAKGLPGDEALKFCLDWLKANP
jgi:TRAP-type transport system periplasmic protein